VDANIATYGGDKNRLFLMGHSAGAYNAVMMGLVGTQYGGPDLAGRVKGVIGLAGPYDFYPFDVQEAIDAFGQVAQPLETQPVELVHPDMPPLLLLHGEKDETCLPRNSRALAARTLAAGGEVETHYYAGLAHAGILLALFRPLRWRAPVYRQALAFMRARLA
jgi:acetyl esterase/lipase